MIEGKNEYYGSRILSILYKQPGLSRSDLAELLNLDRGTVSRIVQYLLSNGLVEEGEEIQESSDQAGRKKIPLFISDTSGYTIGLEVQCEFIKYGALSPLGRELGSGIMYRHGKGNLLKDILTAVELARKNLQIQTEAPLMGVGIALSGLVDPIHGILLFSLTLGAKEAPLALGKALEDQLGVPVFLDNDAKCCCYEVLSWPYQGPGAKLDNFIYTFCEFIENPQDKDRYDRIGIGTAVVLHEKIYYGSRFAAGEFKNLYANPDIPGQFGRNTCDYFTLMRSDPERRSLFIHDLAGSMAYLANFLDIQLVYMGGGIERYGAELQQAFDRAIETTWLYQEYLPRQIQIQFASSDEKPAVRGAAAMVHRHIFAGPIHEGKERTGLAYLQALPGW
ncbi:ROK family transcriptional regulator [Gracilinema caldarium]|uniref:Regulatory protein MarR n=1 Tax=Gracilinema caldarium (strain ATCC 51460 / DSM 7334 / H1) TaxID=744872 RepID=F8F2L1_GRAC1|nr:ROK family transcriptional regulator [Gracilinema caldarium]AEJ19126.1 regulatory protein MarR [Gracilinema caldarium DSM 7334]